MGQVSAPYNSAGITAALKTASLVSFDKLALCQTIHFNAMNSFAALEILQLISLSKEASEDKIQPRY